MFLLFFCGSILYNDTMALIMLSGATGSGKTAVAAALAPLVNGEIVSADSRQVYRHLDIGTNKEGVWDEKKQARVVRGVPQHLTDIIDPSQHFSAGDFASRAETLLSTLQQEGKTPLIVGGTGLYLKALRDGLTPLPPRDEAIRRKLDEELRVQGREHLYRRLSAVDPSSAEKNRTNPQRLIRALEVFELTGTPLSLLQANGKTGETTDAGASARRFLHFNLSWPREELYERINARSREMLVSGMIEETERVLAMGYNDASPGLQGIGYRDIIRLLKGEINREELQAQLAQSTRNYAKRQVTWFRKDGRIRRIEVTRHTFVPEEIARYIAHCAKQDEAPDGTFPLRPPGL